MVGVVAIGLLSLSFQTTRVRSSCQFLLFQLSAMQVTRMPQGYTFGWGGLTIDHTTRMLDYCLSIQALFVH